MRDYLPYIKEWYENPMHVPTEGRIPAQEVVFEFPYEDSWTGYPEYRYVVRLTWPSGTPSVVTFGDDRLARKPDWVNPQRAQQTALAYIYTVCYETYK